jgi:DmsE family decaheme c-type cytochrome
MQLHLSLAEDLAKNRLQDETMLPIARHPSPRTRWSRFLGRFVATSSLVLLAATLASAAAIDGKGKSPAGSSKAPVDRPEAYKATHVGSIACASCHGDLEAGFRRSLHATQKVACEDCHGPGSLHAESGDHQKIVSFSSGPPQEANSWCLSCHATSGGMESWSTNSHARKAVRCADCHKVHVTTPLPASRAEKNAICASCHRKQTVKGSLPFHHPVAEAKMTCVDCHNPHGGRAGNSLRTDGINELCTKCHAEYAGPFTYQHPPVTENCLTCHDAHGSMNRSMLTVSQPMLCLQCHSGHHNGSGVPLLNACTNCHNSIHGSDVSSSTGGSVFIDKP